MTTITRPLVVSTRSTRDPNPIHHLGRQDDSGKWHTLCNGGAAVLIEGPIGNRTCIRCDAARLREATEQQTTPTEEPGAELALTRGMSVEMLEEDLPSLRVGLEAGITAAVTVLRQERGTVVAAEDTFDLIRRLVHAQDVLTRVASAYTDAAKTAGQILAEELATAVGEQDGVPMGRLVVPAGEYEYVLKPVFSTGADTWDWPSLLGVLADLAEEGQPLPLTPADTSDDRTVADVREWGREVAGDALTRFLGLLSAPKLKATAVDTLRRKVSAAGDDQRAAVLGQCRVRGGQTYKETVSVDVEEAKERRR